MDKYSSFDRNILYDNDNFNFIGKGQPGGKAANLIFIKNTLNQAFSDNKFDNIGINIPKMTVILTNIFDVFMKENNLYEIAYSNHSDDIIANHFQKASLPAFIEGDLYTFISKINKPLAIRSSSLYEDKINEPLAGLFETKMISNNQFQTSARFHKLVEAIKYVYASTFFKNSKNYFTAIGKSIKHEKMAVIIQEIVGKEHHKRFYPTISGVARSFNYYPSGKSKAEDGVVSLALGLGKTIVDGGKVWNYSPEHPASPPPFNNIRDMQKMTQTDFWAVNMGKIKEFNPIKETEYLINPDITKAEKDNVIANICSTYDIQSDRIYTGQYGKGPRIINFAPILKTKKLSLNKLIKKLLKICEKKLNAKVEIEFALIYEPQNNVPPKFSLLQVRPMVVTKSTIDIDCSQFDSRKVLAFSQNALGNGKNESIRDIVFVKPEVFETKYTRRIAEEIETINQTLVNKNKNYLLIGFGRWGTSDPWLGIPIVWNQISGAKVIIENALPHINPDFSQGSHFFHNVTSFKLFYFYCSINEKPKIDYNWLFKQRCINETNFVKHVQVERPLKILANGIKGKGIIIK